ncbi:uncharacterized protein METZ01_LOCUS345808 [marine metagenome]|uniref:Co-chaperone DjlA N-terminal domain-containing protein n=1 Tax=marine metagenome TaxID=408172 RepID=A0A382R5D4_9ZZZZ
MDSFLNLFKQTKLNNNTEEINDHLMLMGGILVEAAAIDGKIEKSELSKIKKSLVYFFEINEDESSYIVKKCLEKVDEAKSLYYFSIHLFIIMPLSKYTKSVKLINKYTARKHTLCVT